MSVMVMIMMLMMIIFCRWLPERIFQTGKLPHLSQSGWVETQNQFCLIPHLKVHLNDLNDNAPILPSLAPVVIQAGSSRRRIAQMNATDIDADDSIKYKIIHVSNNGKRKFYVNPSTGDLEVP